jgi:hypothetical protein
MGGDGDYSYHTLLGSIIPKNSISSWRILLDRGLDNFFSGGSPEGTEFVRVQRRVPQIGFKEPQAFLNRLQSFFLGRVVFKLSEV